MRKKCFRTLAAFMAALFIFSTTAVYGACIPKPEVKLHEITVADKAMVSELAKPEPPERTEIQIEEEPIVVSEEPATVLSEEDIELIAIVTMAEAEGEPEEGQRLVVDTILNRMDSPYFPDTVYDVVYQENQFTSMWNGRADRCYAKDEIVQLIREELVSRTNSDVVFFRTQRYSKYGVPLFQVGHHYFSKYA